MLTRSPLKRIINLDVYRNSHIASAEIIKNIIPNLPSETNFELSIKLKNSSRAIPRLITEGYTMMYRKQDFRKYFDEAKKESREMILLLNQLLNSYKNFVSKEYVESLIIIYEKIGLQLFNTLNRVEGGNYVGS